MTRKEKSPSLFQGPQVLGIVRGSSRGRVLLEAVGPALDEDPPHKGDFLLLEESPESALAVRVVAARAGGPFAEGKETGASYLAELLKAGRSEIPSDVKEMLYRLHLDLHLLGRVEIREGRFRFVPGSRDLEPFGHRLRRPTLEALRFLASAGQVEGEDTVPFGVLCRGEKTFPDVPVLFSIDRLKSRRSFVFARAGYGKSNLVKYLVSRLYEHPPEVGLLILDPEGEYAFEQTAEGRRVPGLADHPEIRKRLKVFTSRKAPSLLERYGDVIQTSLQVDFRECEPGEVLTSFIPREKLEQVWSNWIRGLARRTRGGKVKVEDRWAALIDALDRRQYGITDEELHHLIFGRPMKSDQKGGNVSIQAVRNNLVPLVRRLHNPESRLLSATLEHLDRGGVVVLDLSLASYSDSRALADLLLFRVFQSRVQALTHGRKLPPVLAVFEEAQTILSASRDDETSIFTRWVKEGRKYGLGALMITQQPGSISEEIVSQGDNFFVMHLLNENDLRLLQRINAHFTEDILEFIRNEPVKGNCYFWSAPDQPYVVPCRVENFDNYATRPTRRAEGPARVREPRLTPYEKVLLRALAEEERVYLIPAQVPVKGKKAGDLLAVSPRYLQTTALSLLLEEGAPAAAVPKDPMPALRKMGILGPDGPWFAGEGGKGAPWILLDRGRLALACHRAGYTLKPARPYPIRLHPPAEGKKKDP